MTASGHFLAAMALIRSCNGRQRSDGSFTAFDPCCGKYAVSTDDPDPCFVDHIVDDTRV